MKNVAELFNNHLVWKGEDLPAAAEPTFCELFPKGTVHQVFCDVMAKGVNTHAPIALPLVIAKQQTNTEELQKKVFIFIGKECFPSLFFLKECFALNDHKTLKNFIYLNTPNEKAKCWALETALSSTNVNCVMASVNFIPFSMGRRISLLAEKNRALCFLFPTKGNTAEASAARARWRFETKETAIFSTEWSVSLIHIKGTKPKRNFWSVCLEHEKEISLNLLPELVSQSDSIESSRRKCA